MKFHLIGKVLRIGGIVNVNKEIEASNKKEAEIEAKKLIKKERQFPSYRDSCFELLRFVCKIGRHSEIEIRGTLGKSKKY